jgi:hypothetical protein
MSAPKVIHRGTNFSTVFYPLNPGKTLNKPFMKLFIICLLLCSGLAAYSQTFGVIYTDGTWTEKQVEKHLDKQIAKGKKNGSIRSSSKERKGDTLIYAVQNEASSFTIKTLFNLQDKEPGVHYCDYEKYVFDCTCSNSYLQETLKNSGFRKRGENKYLSAFAYRTELTVDYKTESKDCIDMTFAYVSLDKKAYKEIYEKLPAHPQLSASDH